MERLPLSFCRLLQEESYDTVGIVLANNKYQDLLLWFVYFFIVIYLCPWSDTSGVKAWT